MGNIVVKQSVFYTKEEHSMEERTNENQHKETRHCSRCGEEYSNTYRRCPFCQELAAEKRGRPMYRRGKRLSPKQRMSGAFGVMKLVAAAVAVCVLLFVFFGDNIAEFMGIRNPNTTQQQDNQQNQPNNDSQSSDNDSNVPDVPDIPTPPDIPDDGNENNGGDVVIEPLTISQSAITIPAGETARLTISGGSGLVTWESSNEEIATVTDGSVTGVAGGTVTVTATVGEEQITCTVTVTGDPWVSSANLTLSHKDFTLRAGDPPVQLKVKGTENAVTWSSSNTNVATVDSEGVVRRVGKGNCTITAQVDGHTLTCIVRVA